MRLPDSFLDDLRARLSLSQVVGRRVTWDMRKTNQARGDWWAPCPFHQEKSPSFHVDDQKGFYYCFGCQAKGNVFGFVQETENVGFMEAVEILAAEAGMEMPARDQKAAERSDLRTRLADVTEEAAKWFRLQLRTGAAAEARAYLERRGVSEATRDRFEIGFAPSVPDALLKALRAKGIAFDLIEGAGLAVAPEDGREARDRFIHRIIFPIRDARGRCIGFGGRAMNPNAKAKYLNSPATPLFDKGANVYNLGPARQAAGKDAPLIVAEGYMDVIALVQAGFESAVAPLGTAVTETQLRLLWRVTPEPLIALDGDAAGREAGLRVADLALTAMEAGQSLRFAILPAGKDPDDLLREDGSEVMRAVLDDARPMLSLLWDREVAGKSFDSPERRAMLDRDLRTLLRRIADPQLRRHYGTEIARLRTGIFGPEPSAPGRGFDRPFVPRRDFVPGRRWTPPVRAATTTRASALASGDIAPATILEQVALVGLLLHPILIREFAAMLETAQWSVREHDRIAAAILALDPDVDPEGARAEIDRLIGSAPLETLLRQSHIRISPVGRADQDGARICVRDALARLDGQRDDDRDRREAMEDFADGADEGLTWRLAKAAHRREDTRRAAGAAGEQTVTDGSNAAYYDSLLDMAGGKKRTEK